MKISDHEVPSNIDPNFANRVSKENERASTSRVRLCLVMVGLPARGKTYVARRMVRYLTWLGIRTRVFNVGNYRRARYGNYQDASFFDPQNQGGQQARLTVAESAMEDMLAWFSQTGEVGIYDATNTTRERRAWVKEQAESAGLEVVFVESICEDKEVIEANIRETKLRSPDYVGISEAAAVQDFQARIAHYASIYESVREDEGSYIKLFDVGRKLEVHRIRGFWPSRLVYFLMNVHPIPRPIYLVRHGESAFNREGRIGGDAHLSSLGTEFAEKLGAFMASRSMADTAGNGPSDLRIFTSTLRRTLETADVVMQKIPAVRSQESRALDEISAGDCDGMTYDEIRTRLPHEWRARIENKFDYRYPRGESYRDVIRRLEPVIVELEREQAPVLVVAHQAVLRALYAYIMDRPPQECPHIEIPLHTVIRLVPTTYACEEERVFLGPTLPEISHISEQLDL